MFGAESYLLDIVGMMINLSATWPVFLAWRAKRCPAGECDASHVTSRGSDVTVTYSGIFSP